MAVIHDHDDDCTGTTSTTTTTTSTTTTTTTVPSVSPTTVPEQLELSAIGAECRNDIPFLAYEIDFPGGESATITFLNPLAPTSYTKTCH